MTEARDVDKQRFESTLEAAVLTQKLGRRLSPHQLDVLYAAGRIEALKSEWARAEHYAALRERIEALEAAAAALVAGAWKQNWDTGNVIVPVTLVQPAQLKRLAELLQAQSKDAHQQQGGEDGH